jgi:hypothetical protein
LNVVEQFEEWDRELDTLYWDEETQTLMQSVTVQGGDVEQVPYEGELTEAQLDYVKRLHTAITGG